MSPPWPPPPNIASNRVTKAASLNAMTLFFILIWLYIFICHPWPNGCFQRYFYQVIKASLDTMYLYLCLYLNLYLSPSTNYRFKQSQQGKSAPRSWDLEGPLKLKFSNITILICNLQAKVGQLRQYYKSGASLEQLCRHWLCFALKLSAKSDAQPASRFNFTSKITISKVVAKTKTKTNTKTKTMTSAQTIGQVRRKTCLPF